MADINILWGAVIFGFCNGVGAVAANYVFKKYIEPKLDKAHEVIKDGKVVETIKKIDIQTDKKYSINDSDTEEVLKKIYG